MAGGLMDRLVRFLRSPKGQRLTQQAKKIANNPRNQQKARDALNKLRKRR